MKLTLVECDASGFDDWFTIELAEHENKWWTEDIEPGYSALCYSGRITNACVEGTGSEMLMIAEAIKNRSEVKFKRCAVRIEGNSAFFWSPRNSLYQGECTYEEALELVEEINTKLRQPA